MSHLIVVGFKNDKLKAKEVLRDLERLSHDGSVQLQDAAVAYRDDAGKLHIDQSYGPTPDDGAARGLLWGTLIGALLAVPFAGAGAVVAATAAVVGPASGAAAGSLLGAINADWWKEGFGISERDTRQVGTMLEPGDSAVFAVLHTERPDDVANRFEGNGGKVLMTNLSEVQKAAIDNVLSSSRR